MKKQEVIEEIAKLVCGACEMALGGDGEDCAVGNNYKRCRICIDIAKGIYEIFKKEVK